MSDDIKVPETAPVETAVGGKKFSFKLGKNGKMFLFGFGGLLLVVLLILVGVDIYRVYRIAATDKFTVTVARILHLPAAKVDDQIITFADYVDDMSAIKLARDTAKADTANAAGNTLASMSDADLSDQVLWRSTSEMLLNKAAMAFGVTITKDDVENEKKTFLSGYQTTAEAEAEVLKNYGWSLDKFTEKFIRPMVLKTKLDEKIVGDTSKQTAVDARAQGILDQINQGTLTFDDAVKKYSDDVSGRTTGGAMQTISLSQLQSIQPQIATVITNVKAGAVVSTLVKRDYGVDIIKMVDRQPATSTVKDAAGKTVKDENVTLAHTVFLYPSLGDFLDDAVCQAKFHVYLKVNDPFKYLADKCKQYLAGKNIQ